MRKERIRCPWAGFTDPSYLAYHDEEWGVPVKDDRAIFEFLTLEAFQAGLSWLIVLRKRANFRKAFAGFDYRKIAGFTARDVKRLMNDAGIIRNRAKIEATIENARRFMDVQKEFGTFSKYMWSWVGGKPTAHNLKTLKDYPVTTDEAVAWSKDMKTRGFKFLGPTVVYAHMQATGMVNDHTQNCFRRTRVS
jgi:DNA-3-methyladenine glycosylase I